MEKRHFGKIFNEKGAYRTVNAGLVICMELFGGGAFFGISRLTWLHILVAAAVLCLLAGIHFLETRGRILCGSVLLLCLSAAVLAAGPEKSFLFLESYFLWLVGKGGAHAEWAPGHELLQAAALAVIGYLVQILFEKVPLLKIVLAGVLLAGLVICLFTGVELTHLGVVFLLCYTVMVYAEWVQCHWIKVRGKNPRAVMPWLVPFLALYALLAALMPAPRDPYEWRWVKNAYSQIRETFLVYTQSIRWGSREGFDLTLSGFSENGELHGDVQEEAREIMTLRIQDGRLSNMYLTGMLYDTFDGRQWLQKYPGYPQSVFLDTMETRQAVGKYNENFARDYLYQTRLEIRYGYFNSGYLFAPIKTWHVDNMKRGMGYSCEYDWLVMDRRRGYGTEYVLSYYQLNAGQESFYRFIDATRKTEETEEDWREVLKEYEKLTKEAVTYDMVETYRQEIYENYSGDVTLSEEVSAYLSQITAGARTDTEKLRAIEAELASFAYTRTPGMLPAEITDESEFLDYFLLKKREGHCTFFATAFVLLARAEGFPARYVQGFCVPIQNKKEVKVYSNMAHSWPEVYIEGVGWIPFEPTPGYGEIRYTPWRLRQPDTVSAYSSSEGIAAAKPADGITDAEMPQISPEALEIEEEQAQTWKPPLYVLPILLTGFAVILLLDNALGRYRYKKMNPEERFRAEVRRNLWVLSFFGLRRGESETLQELTERGMALPEKGRKESLPLHFIKDYEDITYGGKEVIKEMTENTLRERELLLQLLKKENHWVSLYCRVRLYLVRYH